MVIEGNLALKKSGSICKFWNCFSSWGVLKGNREYQESRADKQILEGDVKRGQLTSYESLRLFPLLLLGYKLDSYVQVQGGVGLWALTHEKKGFKRGAGLHKV